MDIDKFKADSDNVEIHYSYSNYVDNSNNIATVENLYSDYVRVNEQAVKVENLYISFNNSISGLKLVHVPNANLYCACSTFNSAKYVLIHKHKFAIDVDGNITFGMYKGFNYRNTLAKNYKYFKWCEPQGYIKLYKIIKSNLRDCTIDK